MENNTIEQIIQGFEYAKNAANSINVGGIDNCQKIMVIYNNIDIFLNMIKNGTISIIDNTQTNES
ncbi:MAG: hypothetical protein Q4G33_11565 [bacterium]|nr:hypothetical protein [bacterium]